MILTSNLEAIVSKQLKFSRCARPPVLIIGFLLVLCSPVFAQQRVGGTVMSRGTHHPIVATVKLEGELLKSPRTTQADKSGLFAFAGLSPGRYTISVAAAGFYREELTFTLTPRATQRIDLELTPLASLNEEVTVKAITKLLDTEATTATTIQRDQIEVMPTARRMQLTDMVAPFIASAVGSHDNLVHLRGNELSLNTFINGVSFFDNPHQLFSPGFAPEVIQSVNIITGGFPAEFGNRFGGILDVVTRTGFDANNHGSVILGAGDYLRSNVTADYGGHSNQFGYFLNVEAFQSDRYLNTPEPSRFHDRGKGSRAFASLDYRPGANDSFKFLFTLGGTNFELPNTTDDEQRHRDFFQRNREQTAMLQWEHTFSASSAVSTSVYERLAAARLDPTTDTVSIQANGLRNDLTVGLKSDYSLFANPRNQIKAGVDLMLLRLREDFSFDPRENDIELSAFAFRGRRTGGQASFYFQDQIKLAHNLTGNLGLRYDQYSVVTSGHALSPRINLAYSFGGGRTVLHFAYNRFFAPPPIENLLLSAALGFDAQPPRISRSNHFEAGVSQSVLDRVVLRLTGYWRSDKNSFETTELANVRIFAPTSFASGKAYGVEFSAQMNEIKRLGLSGYLSYTAQRAFQTGPIVGGFSAEEVAAGERGAAAFDQIHTAVAGLTWREHRSGFWASTALEYGSGTPAALPDAEGAETVVRLPEHLVANFYLGIDLFRKDRCGVSLQFNVENATDRVYSIAKESEFTPIQFSPPRFLSGSVKLRF